MLDIKEEVEHENNKNIYLLSLVPFFFIHVDFVDGNSRACTNHTLDSPVAGDWSDPANWDNGRPDATLDTYVGHLGGASPVSSVIGAGVSTTTKTFRVGDNTVGTVTMDGTYLRVSGNMDVGYRTDSGSPVGNGTFIQNSGTVYITGTLNIPNTTLCTGTYELNGGSLSVDKLNLVGHLRYGNLQIADGVSMTVRGESRIERDVILPADATVNMGNIFVPYARTDARITVTHYCTNTATVASLALANTVDNTSGTYNLWGGQLTRQHVRIARKSGGNGILNIASNAVLKMGNGVNTSDFQTGENGGTAHINLGDAASSGWFIWTAHNNFHVRMDASSTAILRGVGGRQAGLLNTLQVSGRVIADAWGGAERDLDLASSTLNNTIDNGAEESNGWFAMNGGRLILASKTIGIGNTTYNWGEDAADTDIDLVNSMRLSFTNVTTGSSINNTLLAVDRSDVPHPEQLGTPVAIHHLASDPGMAFDTLTITLRYDALSCEALGYSEPVILHSTGGKWSNPLPTTYDNVNKRLVFTLTGLSGNDYFAQAARVIREGTIFGAE